MTLKLTEHDLQVHIFDVLRLNENSDPRLRWIYAIPNGNYRSYAIGANLKLEGVKAGVADICIPFPGSAYDEEKDEVISYPGAYIEMKSASGSVSPEQKEFLEFVKSQGFAARVCFHYITALDFLEEYCGKKFRGRDRLTRKGIK